MIFVYYGPDYGLNSAKCVEAIKESLKNDIASLIKMDGNNDTILDLINECASISIFEDKKTILFSNATFLTNQSKIKKDDSEQLIDYLSNPEPNTDLYLVTDGELEKRNIFLETLKSLPAVFVNCTKLSLDDYSILAFQRASLEGKEIDYDALSLLYERTKGDYLLFTNELNKLLTYTRHVMLVDVKEMVSKPMEDRIFDIISNITLGKIDEGLKIYNGLINSGSDPISLIPLFANQISFLALVAYLKSRKMSNDDIASELNVKAGRIYYTSKSLAKYNFDSLLIALSQLAELEKNVKLNGDNCGEQLAIYLALFENKFRK